MEREEVKEVFKFLKTVYPQLEVDSDKLNVWHKLLKDQNPARVMRNAEKYAMDNKFPPTVADLREPNLEAHSSDFLAKVREWKENASGKPGS